VAYRELLCRLAVTISTIRYVRDDVDKHEEARVAARKGMIMMS